LLVFELGLGGVGLGGWGGGLWVGWGVGGLVFFCGCFGLVRGLGLLVCLVVGGGLLFLLWVGLGLFFRLGGGGGVWGGGGCFFVVLVLRRGFYKPNRQQPKGSDLHGKTAGDGQGGGGSETGGKRTLFMPRTKLSYRGKVGASWSDRVEGGGQPLTREALQYGPLTEEERGPH